MNPRHGNDLAISVGFVALAIALIVIIIVTRLAGQGRALPGSAAPSDDPKTRTAGLNTILSNG
jgi:hypothetical protein